MYEVFGFAGALKQTETACLLAIGGFALVALVLTAVRAVVTESGRGKRWTANRYMAGPEDEPAAEPPPAAEHADEVAPGLVGLRGRIADTGASEREQE
ncbi:MAG: hypothetical protein QOI02_1342 [Actinomycetota bacterium]|jgi:hypothetical protein|nr:hypothetical protein [Actinomycetota bacterium]